MKTKIKQSNTHRRYGRAAILFAVFLLVTVLLSTLSASAADFSWTKEKVAVHYGTNLTDPDGNNIEAWFTVASNTNLFHFTRTAAQAHHIMHDYRAMNPNSSLGLKGDRNIDYVECFCIEPGAAIHGSGNGYSGKVYTSGNPENMAEHYYKELGDKSENSQKMLNLAMHFGYPNRNDVDTSKEANACYAATQLIVWQCMYGWRTDASYTINDRSVGYGGHSGTMTAQYTANRWVNYYYTHILDDMAEYLAAPTFSNSSYTLQWNSTNNRYETTISDTNGVLRGSYAVNFSASNSNVKFKWNSSAKTVTIYSATELPSSGATVTFKKESLSKTDNFFAWKASDASQQMISGAGSVPGSSTSITVKTGAKPAGDLQIRKTSEDGKISGIGFKIYGPFSSKPSSFTGGSYLTQRSTDANGDITLPELVPGWYFVEEMNTGDSRYNIQPPQCVQVISGKTATVKFHNTLKWGSVHLQKISYDGVISGRTFLLSGKTVTGKQYSTMVTTNAKGEADFEVPPGKYTITEYFENEADAKKYVCTFSGDIVDGGKGSAELEVTSEKTNELKMKIKAENTEPKGSVRIKKSSDDGVKQGWIFELSGKATTTGEKIVRTAQTNAAGIALFTEVPLGSYTIRETNPKIGMTCSIEPSVVEIAEDQQGVEVYAENAASRKVVVMKSSDDGIVSGFKFRLMGNGYNQTVTTDDSGRAVFYNVPNGYYVLTEDDIPFRYTSWNNVVREFVLTDEDMAIVVHAHNSLKRGNLHVIKSTDDGTLRGFRFHLYGESWFEGSVDLYAETDGNGDAWFRDVPFGDGYILEEVELSDDYIYPAPVPIDINDAVAAPWEEYTVHIGIHNPSKPKVQDLALLKFTDDGQIEGFGFQLTGTTLAGEDLERYQETDEYGVALFDSLPYGSYTLEETLIPQGYEKHDPVSFTIGEGIEFCASIGPVWDISGGIWNEGKDSWGLDAASLAAFEGKLIDLYGYGYPADHTAGIVIYNPSFFVPGKITVQKLRSDTGKAAADAEFLLEWSEDGEAWDPVFFTAEMGAAGGCTSAGLEDGKLVTGEDGLVIFEGLHPAVYYRLTETKAPAGMQLLTDPAFEGKLPEDDGFELAMNVVNSPILKLPMTGGQPGGRALRTAWSIWFLITAGFAAVVICPVLVRKIKQKNSKRKEK